MIQGGDEEGGKESNAEVQANTTAASQSGPLAFSWKQLKRSDAGKAHRQWASARPTLVCTSARRWPAPAQYRSRNRSSMATL